MQLRFQPFATFLWSKFISAWNFSPSWFFAPKFFFANFRFTLSWNLLPFSLHSCLFFLFTHSHCPAQCKAGCAIEKGILLEQKEREGKLSILIFIWGNKYLWINFSFRVYNRFYENVKMIIFRVGKSVKEKLIIFFFFS